MKEWMCIYKHQAVFHVYEAKQPAWRGYLWVSIKQSKQNLHRKW